jgi:hypothetical protein
MVKGRFLTKQTAKNAKLLSAMAWVVCSGHYILRFLVFKIHRYITICGVYMPSVGEGICLLSDCMKRGGHTLFRRLLCLRGLLFLVVYSKYTSALGAHRTLKQVHYASEIFPNFCGKFFFPPFSYQEQKHVNLENISRYIFLIQY